MSTNEGTTLPLAQKRSRPLPPVTRYSPQMGHDGTVHQVVERPAGRRTLPRVIAQRPRCTECDTPSWTTTTSKGDDEYRLTYAVCALGHHFTIEWQ